MLFIKRYNQQSLDRSSVSMFNKYNLTLDKIGSLLKELSDLVANLLSLIVDIKNTLGECKQHIYNNLDQVKEVIDGNGITGTEGIINTIEALIETGDAAIGYAEQTLEGVQGSIECNETVIDIGNDDFCGEQVQAENPEPDGGGCFHCSYSYILIYSGGSRTQECSVGLDPDCTQYVNTNCDEQFNGPDFGTADLGCSFAIAVALECSEAISHRVDCDETACVLHSGTGGIDDGCTFTCTHSSDCGELPMPDNCSYLCQDGGGCSYGGTDCSYSSCTVENCGQACYEGPASDICGEACGETCHMTTEPEDRDDDCSETSCGECSDDLSDDDYYGGGDDSTDTCGEDCGDSCGLF